MTAPHKLCLLHKLREDQGYARLEHMLADAQKSEFSPGICTRCHHTVDKVHPAERHGYCIKCTDNAVWSALALHGRA